MSPQRSCNWPAPRARVWVLVWFVGCLAVPAASARAQGELALTVNAVPEEQSSVLVLPGSGFSVEVEYSDPALLTPGSERLLAVGVSDYSRTVDLSASQVVSDPDRAVWLVDPTQALSPGSWKLVAVADRTDGQVATTALPVAVREPELGFPLATTQKVFLDLGEDRDVDGQVDLIDDLLAFGLLDAADAPEADTMRLLVELNVLSFVAQTYAPPDPSGLSGFADLEVSFSTSPPAGEHTRICIGGDDPAGGSVIGNVLFDAGNLNKADEACGDLISTGVFPGELVFYSFSSTYQNAFGPVLAQPVGSLALDDWLSGGAYDPGDPAWQARQAEVLLAVETFSRAVASITAHEVAHALGLVPPGSPGAGLFGGSSGPGQTHNLAVGGGIPSQNWLMNQGSSFSFDELVGEGGEALPSFRPLNLAYLRGRVLVDARVTRIDPPPLVGALFPAVASAGGPAIVQVVATGSDLGATPGMRLLGPTQHTLTGVSWVTPGVVSGYVQTLQLLPGVYDLELTNPDGQVSTLAAAFTLE